MFPVKVGLIFSCDERSKMSLIGPLWELMSNEHGKNESERVKIHDWNVVIIWKESDGAFVIDS